MLWEHSGGDADLLIKNLATYIIGLSHRTNAAAHTGTIGSLSIRHIKSQGQSGPPLSLWRAWMRDLFPQNRDYRRCVPEWRFPPKNSLSLRFLLQIFKRGTKGRTVFLLSYTPFLHWMNIGSFPLASTRVHCSIKTEVCQAYQNENSDEKTF